jgi:two-component system sensor histidine kinase PhoQ
MKAAASIRSRLLVGAALVLLAFMAIAGYAVQRAHADSVRSAHFARLQSTVYLLLAGAELNADGTLNMPPELAEPRLSLPGSGLYARVSNIDRKEQWRSPSSVGQALAFPDAGAIGEWRFDEQGRFLAASYTVKWAVGSLDAPLALSVLEDRRELDREIAIFTRTLALWLGGASALLLVAQTVLLAWGLEPLRLVTQEIRRIESGEQPEVQGRYPAEIAALTENINALIRLERLRLTRYKEALSYLAHSLKTPLAVLRTAGSESDRLPQLVDEQVARMDDIVQHQLARAASGTGPLFVAPLKLRDVLDRIRASLLKVYADKGLIIELNVARDMAWRIGEGDAFELFGNLMDNASKWAHQAVRVHIVREGRALHACIEDDGPGFKDTESILQLHVRGDEKVPGHGVGLAVVSELVKAHRGDLRLGSSSALGGAQVDVVLRPA